MNVIVVCIDTLRYDYLGAYGGTAANTPALDRFADDAVRFDVAYCGSFPTVPVRVDAYTGDVNWPRYGWASPEADQPVFLERLRNADYHTGLVLDTKNNVGAGLHEYYDEHHLIEKPVDDGTTESDIEVPFPRENVRADGDQYVRQMVEQSHYETEQDWFVARTMLRAGEWVETNADRDFFLWVDTFEPHEVWDPPEHYLRQYSADYDGTDYSYPNYGPADTFSAAERERLRARYAGEVTLTDRWFGWFLDHLDYLGVREETAIVVLGDHGMYLGERDRVGKHSVEAGEPWPLYDEVARLPLLVSVPWADGGTSTDALAQPADIAPTVLDLAGQDPGLDGRGRSWVPAIRGEGTAGHDRLYTSFHSWDGRGAIDYLDSGITVTTPRWTLGLGTDDDPTLFDRVADPDQTADRANDRPGVVADLRADLAAFMEAQGADPEYVAAYARE